MTNIVSNAVKFTPEGGTVRVTAHRDGQVARISCADSGMGIPEADQKRLFTRFFRASNAQKGQIQGTGLGLVIVRTIAEAHGGEVELSSVEGEGTTVTITLPVAEGDAG
ncbi:sensor histidine kinase [Janibacter hoylei]|uniref:sensor histidine kinase n=1 Tax=Janibacter hoylei TaxID=364298 RepID=UPI0021A49278|nr:ATP-binding protein [Janibacter hoylei]MCT1620205.1 ATP-binding protein [Janibacter hoylei]MCT2294404.1 ATP-binding protein [Janibacter hoylei]